MEAYTDPDSCGDRRLYIPSSFFWRQHLPSCLPHHHIPSNSLSKNPPPPLKRHRYRRNLLLKLCTSKTSMKGSKSQVRSLHDALLVPTAYRTTPLGTTVLKASLRGLFKSYGEVLDVVAHKNLRMRGQAFVSFASTDIAKKAAKEVRGFPLYSKPMVRCSRDPFLLIYQAVHSANIVCEVSVRCRSEEAGSFGIGCS